MDPVADGHYASTQLGSKNKVIAWSHQSRFVKALSLIGNDVNTLLDYGCGDGTFLVLAADRVAEGHGCDVDANQIENCRTRLSNYKNITFHVNDELSGPDHKGEFDVVTCMETLEHCTDEVVEIVLSDVARLVAPNGRVIISVPIEVGPSFIAKQSIRAIARRQGASSYQLEEKYSARDAVKMLFARRGTYVERKLLGEPPMTGHSHYGFNWRRLRERVAAHLNIEDTMFTPLGAFGGFVSSQAYFVCRPMSAR